MKMGKIAVTPNNDKAASHSKDENLATNTIKKNVKPKYGDAAFLEYTLDIKISNIRDERNRKRTGIILGK